jgi:glycine/D-amino acid oxidase-like deaminating enzyme
MSGLTRYIVPVPNTGPDERYDVVVVGGGFYGCVIAAHSASNGTTVAVLEQAPRLLSRASFANQARIHNGYHYPRSFTTGWRSHENYRRFVTDFSDCVHEGMTSLYAIARSGSKTTTSQFERFCRVTGAPTRPARPPLRKLFSTRFVDAVFEVEEVAFDALRLRRQLEARLLDRQVAVHLGHRVVGVDQRESGVQLTTDRGLIVQARAAVNCTYAGVNHLHQRRDERIGGLKHEVAEMPLIRVPDELSGLGITVMDGPFFSIFPFPARKVHALSHVRHTPHAAWTETESSPDPYALLAQVPLRSRFPAMVRDAARFVPSLARCEHVESLFEIKTVPATHEIDDGRPILLRRGGGSGRVISVLGSKMDNIYDVIPQISEFLANVE